MLLRFDVHLLYTPIYRFSPSYFQNSLSTVSIWRVNGIPLWVFYPSDFQRALKTRGGTCQNFDRDARPIFLGLKFGQILFFWVGKFFSYFSGFRKNFCYFLGLTNFQLFFKSSYFCITHLNPLNEEHTVLKNIKS